MPKNRRKPHPSDVTDEEWAFVAPYLAMIREDAPQRNHDLREVFDALRWIVSTDSSWLRYIPDDLPPWEAIYQQTQHCIATGIFAAMVHDLEALLRLASGRALNPTAAVLDSCTLRSTPESDHRSGYDGAKRKKDSKVQAAADTLGHLLAARHPGDRVGPHAGRRACEALREAAGKSVRLDYVDRGYTGEEPV